jgi:hypothetical protein
VDIIRKKLEPSELWPTDFRYDVATDTFQRTFDGGDTWQAANDIRHDATARRPVGSQPRCDSATRIVGEFKDLLNTFYQATTAAEFAASALGLALLIFFPPVGFLFDLAVGVFEALIALGYANIQAAFTDTVWDQLTCIVLCDISPDGSVSEAQVNKILGDASAQISSLVGNVLTECVQMFGEVGLSNAAVERSEVGDCDECATCTPACVSDTFTTGRHDWENVQFGTALRLFYATGAQDSSGMHTQTGYVSLQQIGIRLHCNERNTVKIRFYVVTTGGFVIDLDVRQHSDNALLFRNEYGSGGAFNGWTSDFSFPAIVATDVDYYLGVQCNSGYSGYVVQYEMHN